MHNSVFDYLHGKKTRKDYIAFCKDFKLEIECIISLNYYVRLANLKEEQYGY